MTTIKTFFPENREDLWLGEENKMINAIKESNLPEEYKFAVLAKMCDLDTAKGHLDNFIKETILRVLTQENRPMRISEFNAEPDAPCYYYSNQKIGAMMHELVVHRMVKRMVVKTGKRIEVAPNKIIDEEVIYFEIVG